MFSRKRSSIRANTEIFWLKIHFRIPYKLKWSVRNILPGEERNTEKHNPGAGPSSPNSFKRDKLEEYWERKFTSPAEQNLKTSASWCLPIICGHYFMWRGQSTPSKSHNGSWRLAYVSSLHVSSLHERRFIHILYIYIFLHFSEGASPSRVSGAPALALPEKCEKIKPFMKTNVRLPTDTIAGASQ